MKELFANDKINESAFVDASSIVFDEKFRDYCTAGVCGRYGKTWNCPPEVGEFEKCRNYALSFDKAFVFTHQGRIDDFADVSAMNKLRDETMEILFDICDRLRSRNIRFQPLGCGSCNECEKCTYPDAPCRYPERAVPPVESYGIDVKAIADANGMTYYAQSGIVTFFCIILYDL